VIKDGRLITNTNSRDENLFKISNYVIFAGIAWKVFANLSLFIRKPLENLCNTRLIKFRSFEKFANHWSWLPILLGIVLLIYLYYNNKDILKRVQSQLLQIFGWKKEETKYHSEIVNLKLNKSTELVIYSKKEEHVTATISSSNSILFSDFLTAIQNWNPRQTNDEKIYQDRLYRHLRMHMPDAAIQLEYPIRKVSGKAGRLDIVINDTILIEMKRDFSAGAIQRSTGQLMEYSDVWSGKGPIILLLFDIEYEKARQVYQPTMNTLANLNVSALTIVARNKGGKIAMT
jgi:hypothetical protein